MSPNYRHNNDWQIPTVKYRKNGQWQSGTLYRRQGGSWIEINSDEKRDTGSGDIPERFHTDGPPTRSGNTYIYPDDFSGSIENAIYSLNEEEELYIETDTYHENISLDDSVSNHITIRGDLELTFDSAGRASVIREGPTITNSGNVFETDLTGYRGDASLVGSHDRNDTQIHVTDASPFSPGDVIFLQEDIRPWGEPPAGGANGTSDTEELAKVKSVNTTNNVLTLDHGIHLYYPNDHTTSVGIYTPTVKDIRISGIRFDGQSAGVRPVRIYSTENAWIDNIIVENAGDDNLMAIRRCFRNRMDRIHVENGDHYGINHYSDSTDCCVTNASGRDHSRYTVRFGDASAGGYAANITGESLRSRTVVNVHHGGFDIRFHKVTAIGSQLFTPRSRYLTLEDFESNGNDEGPDIVFAQRPSNVHIHKGTVHSKSGSEYVFRFRMRDDNNSPYGNERFDEILIEDIDIENYGVSARDLGHFQIQGDPPTSGSLTIRNVTYNGTPITRSDVESWNGYNSDYIENLTVE